MNRILIFQTIAIAVAGQTAFAEDPREKWVPREACAPIYAVQKRGCELVRAFQCTDENREFLLYETFTEGVPATVSAVELDGNQLWFRSEDYFWDESVGDVRDPFSLADLFENGSDEYDVTSRLKLLGERDGSVEWVGKVELSDKVIAINGIEFRHATEEAKMSNPDWNYLLSGDKYIDTKTGVAISGTFNSRFESSEGVDHQVTGGFPAEVILPDNPEFQVKKAKHDCRTAG